MIMLTRISGQQFVLNADLIERVDVTPDTVVTLVDGKKYVVCESAAQIISEVRVFRGEVIALSQHISVEHLLPSQEEERAEDAERSSVVALHSATRPAGVL